MRELLLSLVKQRGNCIPIKCKDCPFGVIGFTGVVIKGRRLQEYQCKLINRLGTTPVKLMRTRIYEQSLELYVKRYGKDLELLEVLI